MKFIVLMIIMTSMFSQNAKAWNPSKGDFGWDGKVKITPPKNEDNDSWMGPANSGRTKRCVPAKIYTYFRIYNKTANRIKFSIKKVSSYSKSFSLKSNHSKRFKYLYKIRRKDCKIKKFSIHLDFDNSFKAGYQKKSETVGWMKKYYFRMKGNHITFTRGVKTNRSLLTFRAG